MQVVGTIIQKIDHPFAGTYFGIGKIHDLHRLVERKKADYVIVNDELTPSQIRNLESMTDSRIIDRTGLILEIFADRARTKEAQLQIRLAKLKYQLPRLRTSASVRLDQQTGTGGGSYTNRGAGETLIEMKRRTVTHRINNTRHALKTIRKTNRTQSQRRNRTPIPKVALVGYTNAGKSTILNQLIQRFGSNQAKRVKVKNMLFATLSTKVRRLNIPNHFKMLISDTVGFVSKLPHELVSAFRSTLAEAANADLLLEVVDMSKPNYHQTLDVTQRTLKKIGITNVPAIIILNQADRTTTSYPRQIGNELIMSANDSDSIRVLTQMIKEKLNYKYTVVNLLIPYTREKLVARFNAFTNVISTQYLNQGTRLRIKLPKALAKKYQRFLV